MMDAAGYDILWKENWVDSMKYGPSLRFEQKIISRLLSGLEYRSILDVGCGNGVRLAQMIADPRGIQVAGVDISSEAILQASALFPQWRFQQLNVEERSLDTRFDLVICSEVLEHVTDDVTVIRNLYAMTGKYLLVTAPQGKMRKLDKAVGHVRRYRRGELQEKLVHAGFRIQNVVEWGFPFFSPIHRYFLDRYPGASEGKFGWKQIVLAEAIYRIFHLNSWKRGDILVALAQKPDTAG